jgi:hypothetical protein
MTRFVGTAIKWQKCCPRRRKKPKIDLWEITGCAQIQEIERPVTLELKNQKRKMNIYLKSYIQYLLCNIQFDKTKSFLITK